VTANVFRLCSLRRGKNAGNFKLASPVERRRICLRSGFEKVERGIIDAFILDVQLAFNSQIGCDLDGVFPTHD
jgi:hypothetical protein